MVTKIEDEGVTIKDVDTALEYFIDNEEYYQKVKDLLEHYDDQNVKLIKRLNKLKLAEDKKPLNERFIDRHFNRISKEDLLLINYNVQVPN